VYRVLGIERRVLGVERRGVGVISGFRKKDRFIEV
jgi:hypothetical protein